MKLPVFRRKKPWTQAARLKPMARQEPAAEGPSTEVGLKTCQPETSVDQAVTALREAIPPVVTSLEEFIEGSESDFMLLGIGLRTVHANVKELTELMLDTVKQMGTGEEGGFLERGRQALNESLAEIRSYQEGVKKDLARINTVMENLEDLYLTSKQIKKFAKSLKTVALAMLVENARTIDSSVNIFSDVALEVKELSVSIAGIANDVYKNVEQARKIHHDTQVEISAGIDRLETLTSEIQSMVKESTRDTEALMQFSMDTIEQAGRRSRDISRQVAEIVVGVQFHDNMKQRVMHIVSILRAMADSAQARPPAEDFSPATGLARTEPVLYQQSGLLDEMTTEVSQVY
ncbi:MAG: hypothetical protein ACOC3F_01615, partial [Desulfosudaceae bacterium]